MRSTFFLTILIPVSQTTLLAQSPAPSTGVQEIMANANHTIKLLEQNTYIVMIGVLALLAMAWVAYVLSACTQVRVNKQVSHRNILSMLFLWAGLITFCSSCSSTQQMRATEMMTDRKNGNQYCTCPSRHNESQYFNTPLNSTYYNNGYANWRDNPCCRQCGRRIIKNKV